jgi:anaerobic selenocysteine-containing dehydrogenase
VILPGLSPLEQPHYDELIWSWAVRNAGKVSEPVFAPEPGRPHEWEILLTLSALLQGQKPADVDVRALDQLFFAGLVAGVAALPGSRIAGRDPGEIVAQHPEPGPARLLDFQIRSGPWGDAYGANPGGLTLEELARHPNGLDRGPLEPRLDELLRTPSGRIELAPEHIVADVPRLRARLGRGDAGLVLVSRRHVRSNNSWMHNVPELVTGRDRCTLLVHPEDAARAGVVDGGRARIRSSAGSLVVPVEVSDEMRPGVVCLPHGWGHDKKGARLSVASRHAGVCNNVLAPGALVDAPSGNAVVNGIPVELAPA